MSCLSCMFAGLLHGLGWAGTAGEASLMLKFGSLPGRHAAEACLSRWAKSGPQLACPQQ